MFKLPKPFPQPSSIINAREFQTRRKPYKTSKLLASTLFEPMGIVESASRTSQLLTSNSHLGRKERRTKITLCLLVSDYFLLFNLDLYTPWAGRRRGRPSVRTSRNLYRLLQEHNGRASFDKSGKCRVEESTWSGVVGCSGDESAWHTILDTLFTTSTVC